MDKAHILAEIKRTTKANGGVALGHRRLFDATGIKETDWGRYWPRYADAIREAGFEPNSMSVAYPETDLIVHLASLSRENGRFPTWAELNVKSYSDGSFPSSKTFRKLGSKQEIVTKVLAYCRSKPELADVIAMCEAATKSTVVLANLKQDKDAAIGFVYLIRSGRYYKIGRSNAVGRRERELAIQLPDKAGTVHVISTDDPAGIEVYWHRRFDAKRKNGEWFDLSSAEVSAFKRRKFM